LNDWDPIGVFDPNVENESSAPVDEYDCVRDPLISRLLRGDSRHEVAEFLHEELTDHFGLEPWLVTPEVIDRVFKWWDSVR
jgi:hypothetical protein